MKTIKKLRKWGDSIGITLNKIKLEKEGLKIGDIVSVEVKSTKHMSKKSIKKILKTIAEEEGFEEVGIVGKKKIGDGDGEKNKVKKL